MGADVFGGFPRDVGAHSSSLYIHSLSRRCVVQPMLFANALTVLNRFQQWAHYVPLLFQALVDASALPLEEESQVPSALQLLPKTGNRRAAYARRGAAAELISLVGPC